MPIVFSVYEKKHFLTVNIMVKYSGKKSKYSFHVCELVVIYVC